MIGNTWFILSIWLLESLLPFKWICFQVSFKFQPSPVEKGIGETKKYYNKHTTKHKKYENKLKGLNLKKKIKSLLKKYLMC